MMLVKLLMSIFRGHTAIMFKNMINLEIQAVPFLANYILIIFAIGITILFQSSSVTTSTLTPLCGIGLVKIDKMFAFTVGANIGTTMTGILGALVSDKRKTGMTVAFSHLLFNLLGTVIWYPIPLLRNVPITMAKTLGNIAADLKSFPICYIIFTFGLLPLLLLGLSVASPWACIFVGVPFVLFLLGLITLIGLRDNKPHLLPEKLKQDPDWLINSLRVNKLAEEPAASAAPQSSSAAVSADLGKGTWRNAPAAWGIGWLILLARLATVFNAKWADMKYQSWDKRNHYGLARSQACSYAFEKDMKWAPQVDTSLCSASVLNACGADLIKGCKGGSFSEDKGANAKYEKAWTNCRTKCATKQW